MQPKFKHAVDTRPEMVLDALEADERGIACGAPPPSLCLPPPSRPSLD